ncbi:DUF7694 domain-containing protein [Salipiger thiooxidans]|uniref:DUF7694 domain-containing protein n=1 Tax=Salipiger thiooxidans TaxID=282683 RepID=UPI001CF94712|nr:hypothetical protein [Salipiger thiooxidans]
MNRAMNGLAKKDQAALLTRERKLRRTGEWGEWETLTLMPGQAGNGWAAFITTAHRNRVFSVLDRQTEAGVRHLAVSSLSGTRPTWHEMQRIKDELAGRDATAIEVYPPRDQVVDEADMFHIWVLRGNLPFGLHLDTIPPAATALRAQSS